MAVKIPLYLFSHHRKIAYTYKKWLRFLESHCPKRDDFRYQARLVRAEFDIIYYEKDMRKSKQMLLDKEEELLKFPLPKVEFATSPLGVAYDRVQIYEDCILDLWHPLEKAIYPDYFTRRELRKQQYLEMWERMHSPPKPVQ